MDARRLLEAHTRRLLTAGDYAGDQLAAARDLHALLGALSGLDRHAGADVDRARILSVGKAISPRDAARGVLDFKRTAAFLLGLESAIRAALSGFDERPVHVLYAGCGPLAPLAICLMPRFPPAEVQFTLVDVHDASIDCARRQA